MLEQAEVYIEIKFENKGGAQGHKVGLITQLIFWGYNIISSSIEEGYTRDLCIGPPV